MTPSRLTRHTRLVSAPLPRGLPPDRSKGLARTGFRRKRSKKQSRREREWSRLKRQAIAERGDVCQVCGAAKAEHAHHVIGKLIQTLAALLLVCFGCHRRIHDNPKWAYENGWLLKRNGGDRVTDRTREWLETFHAAVRDGEDLALVPFWRLCLSGLPEGVNPEHPDVIAAVGDIKASLNVRREVTQ